MVDLDGDYMDAFCEGVTITEPTDEDGSMKVAACMLYSVSWPPVGLYIN
jgi:hypothetical protein